MIDDLVECGALRFGEFTLTSGRKSRYYVDVKKASARPDILSRITDGFVNMGFHCDKVAGMELGAVPLIVAYSLRTGVPFVIIRKGDRAHGTRGKMEGDIRPGEKVLLLEDVVTSGGSVIKAAEEIERGGGDVVAILSVVDREEGGTEKVGGKAPFHPLVRVRELLEIANERH